MGCSYGELTADGKFVVVTGDPDHPNAANVGDSPACDAGDVSTYVFDRDGNTVLTWRHDQNRAGLRAAVLTRTGQRLNLQESVGWDVQLTPAEAASLPDLADIWHTVLAENCCSSAGTMGCDCTKPQSSCCPFGATPGDILQILS